MSKPVGNREAMGEVADIWSNFPSSQICNFLIVSIYHCKKAYVSAYLALLVIVLVLVVFLIIIVVILVFVIIKIIVLLVIVIIEVILIIKEVIINLLQFELIRPAACKSLLLRRDSL